MQYQAKSLPGNPEIFQMGGVSTCACCSLLQAKALQDPLVQSNLFMRMLP